MMLENQEQINQLSERLDGLMKRQQAFDKEIRELRVEIYRLRHQEPTSAEPTVKPHKTTVKRLPNIKADLEKFIGENLINKIGIIIIIVGVGIGTKYSIERDLINPTARLTLGYLTGLGLLFFALILKNKYESYSAVLVSGAMSILYFITYMGHSFYGLIPQGFAFVLMGVFTAFTTVAALKYNRQVIAHIGFVGAYAVPFLLSDGSGNASVLFLYMAIINAGILAVAFRKYWKMLSYAAFGLTWLVYLSWYVFRYEPGEHFKVAIAFLTVFFILFYLTALAYKLRQDQTFKVNDVLLILSNSFIFYGMGYALLQNQEGGRPLLGVFTMSNAIVHLIVSAIIYRQKLGDRNLFYLVSGLMLVFLTITIPVQLSGNWVTLLWAGEAALLFWIGRQRGVAFYERLSGGLMLLAFLSIGHDWMTMYDVYQPENPETRIIPLMNINFLSSLLVVLAFGFINVLNHRSSSNLSLNSWFERLISFSIPAFLILILYVALQMEIGTYWNQLQRDVAFTDAQSRSLGVSELERFKSIWMINFTLFFVAVLSLANITRLKHANFGRINLGLNALAIGLFLGPGLYVLSELNTLFLEAGWLPFYLNGAVRYISLGFVTFTLIVSHVLVSKEFMKKALLEIFALLLHTTVLWVLSSELIHWMNQSASMQSYKLGLSILWGLYALFLIGLGIWKKKKYIRISAIVLFGVTLIKLFLFDIRHLDTISKTIVFVSLGAVLLVISFLYNKYKHVIFDDLS